MPESVNQEGGRKTDEFHPDVKKRRSENPGGEEYTPLRTVHTTIEKGQLVRVEQEGQNPPTVTPLPEKPKPLTEPSASDGGGNKPK